MARLFLRDPASAAHLFEIGRIRFASGGNCVPDITSVLESKPGLEEDERRREAKIFFFD
jgi:hypothetical protein